jgi:hypothetical protein
MSQVREKETALCPICGKPMQEKKATKQSEKEPALQPTLVEFECVPCGHVEGHHGESGR